MKAAPGDPSSAGQSVEQRTETSTSPQRRGWRSWHTLWVLLLLGWTVSAADRAVTGPVVTWMIDNGVGFLADAENPHALGGLVGGLFFAGYMLTQFPGGYLGDRYGHRTLIVVSLLWAGVATVLTGFVGGLVAFIVVRVVTGLGEGAFYSNDRTLITATTPERDRSLAMGVVITGLSLGITIAIVFTPELVEFGEALPRSRRIVADGLLGAGSGDRRGRRRRGVVVPRPSDAGWSEPGDAASERVRRRVTGPGHGRLLAGHRRRTVRAVDRAARSRPRRRPGALRARTEGHGDRARDQEPRSVPALRVQHRHPVEPVVLQLLVGLHRGRSGALVVHERGADRRIQRGRGHSGLPGRAAGSRTPGCGAVGDASR